MAQRGYPGIHAGMPTTQCLRSASVVNGALRSRSRSKAKQSGGMSSIYVAVPLLSRASSLPHGVVDVRGICKRHKKLWERARSR
ncbi:nucleoid-structuring protein H-NS [Pseudomonas brassicacearum]|nr:nucleoid-structuring protein H-NS [Pseudomonas brassicacearum]